MLPLRHFVCNMNMHRNLWEVITCHIFQEECYLVRMNMYFDENYVLGNRGFHCCYQKVHPLEIPQEDVTSKIQKHN